MQINRLKGENTLRIEKMHWLREKNAHLNINFKELKEQKRLSD